MIKSTILDKTYDGWFYHYDYLTGDVTRINDELGQQITESLDIFIKMKRNSHFVECIKKFLVEIDQSDGCPFCGMAYSFYFGVQFHKNGCPLAKKEEEFA